MMDFGFDAFDIFNTNIAEEKTEVKEEVKETVTEAPAAEKKADTAPKAEEEPTQTTPSGVPFVEDTDGANIEDEDDSDELTTSDDEEKADAKKSSKKKAAAPKKDTKLKGVVKVVGNGWHTTYGENGKEYEPGAVASAVYEMGYKEIAVAEIKSSATTLFVNTVNQKPTSDDIAMGNSLTIELGNFKVTYQASDFAGLTAKEISLFDVAMKFWQDNPQFAGCGLKVHNGAKVAVPTFSNKATIKPEVTYPVWTDSGIQQMIGADIKDDDVYVSETGTYFVVNAVPKSASTVSAFSVKGIPSSSKDTKAVEVYRLPFNIWVEQFGTTRPCTSADFGGKETVTKEDIIRFLGGAYRIFRSQSRKFSICYDRNTSTVGVAVVSGEKGAVAKTASSNIVSFFDYRERLLSSVKERVEETALGLFKGYEDEDEMLSLDVFEMSLPKIPGTLLDLIIKEFKRDLTRENMIQIYYSAKSKSYYLVQPKAVYNKVSVKYQMTHHKDVLAMTIHSHNTMPAKFSRVDDEDEIYTGLFGVIGDLDKHTISMSFRAGMEGKFKTLYYADIFTNGGEIA